MTNKVFSSSSRFIVLFKFYFYLIIFYNRGIDMNEKKMLNQLITSIMEERRTGINPDDVEFEQILENELIKEMI